MPDAPVPIPFEVRDAAPGDAAALLRLNAASVDQLSPLDADALERLLADCALARVAVDGGRIAGAVLALREGTAYGSPNYRWFVGHVPVFLYVDRVVVDAAFRGRGIARRLYGDVFAFARRAGVPCVACEYDLDPPNAASAAFHRAMGFAEVGRQVLPGGKTVSLQLADVPG